MIGEVFEALNGALAGPAWLALAAAFVWGVLSIVLSPCHLASIPLIVAFINGQGRISTARAVGLSSLFAGGILVTIAALGVVTALAGRLAGDLGPWAYYAVAAVFLLVGLHLLDVLPALWSAPSAAYVKRRGLLAALLLGLIFGVALGPCTFAFMAPLLGIAFKAGAEAPVYAALLLIFYGVGHCLVIVAAGSATGWVQRYLNWSERSHAAVWMRRACGVLVIGGGLLLIYVAP